MKLVAISPVIIRFNHNKKLFAFQENSVSEIQLTSLLDYLEGHQDLALGRLHRTMEGRNKSKRLWEECANTLNSISPDAAQKSADGWRTYYSDYKSKILKKVKAYKASLSATGGGKQTLLLLTPLQERLYAILGRDVGEPLPGVRQNPLSNEDNVTLPYLPVEDEQQPYLYASQVDLETSISMDALRRSHTPDSISTQIHTTGGQTHSGPAPRQQRRRRRRRESPQRTTTNSSASFLQEIYQQVEAANSQAILVHARAVNRLAAAIELLAANFAEAGASPATMERPPKKRFRRRRRVSTTDDSN